MAKSQPVLAWHRCPNCGNRAYVREGTMCFCDDETETEMDRIVNPPMEPAGGVMSVPYKRPPGEAKKPTAEQQKS